MKITINTIYYILCNTLTKVNKKMSEIREALCFNRCNNNLSNNIPYTDSVSTLISERGVGKTSDFMRLLDKEVYLSNSLMQNCTVWRILELSGEYRKEQFISGKQRLSQFGISEPGQVFIKLSDLFNCAH